ncbi:hypothetical protein BDZ88DRAFT_469591 [Geranomyces variabilis]|nr:hypothetical protein BDZ88DRAFT_469591 [Geranomyces variabilis]KAJ3138005.1 hypothetical protein HDU90_001481 [Geranomyces variabilis]
MSSLRKARSQKLAESSNYSSRSQLAAPAPEAVPPDIIYKISKKIAQLTKVIYYLNTKNEDHAVEIQSLAEAYEDEIQDVILDGRKQIDSARMELEDAQKSLQTKDEKLKAHIVKVNEQTTELEALRLQAATLQQNLEVSEGERIDAQNRLDQQTKLVDELTAERTKLTEELESSRTEIEERLKEQEWAFNERLKDVRSQAVHASQELRANHDRDREALHGAVREEAQAQLEQAVVAARAEQEQKLETCLVEIQDLEKKLRRTEDQHRREAAALEERLSLRYEEEHSKLLEVESAKAEADATIERKSEQSAKLQKELEASATALRQTEKAVAERVAQTKVHLEQILELRQKIHALEVKVKTVEIALEEKAQEVQTGLDLLGKANAKYSEVQEQLEKKATALKHAEIKIQALDEAKQMVEADASDKDSTLAGLQKYLQDESDKSEQILKESLEKQRAELAEKSAAELAAAAQAAAREHKRVVDEKDTSIFTLRAELATERSEAAAREKVLAASEQALMDQIRDYQREQVDIEKQLKSATDQLNDQIREDIRKTEIIQQLKETAKNLEIDKADLFQRMVHLDEEIRQETQDRVEKEKTNLIREMHMKAVREAQLLEKTLQSTHEEYVKNLLANREQGYDEQIQAIRMTHAQEMSRMQKLITTAEADLAAQREENSVITGTHEETVKLHKAALAYQVDAHRRQMAEAKAQWEMDLHARETELKATAAATLQQLEKQAEKERAELESAHQNQLDNLRTFHTKANLDAKKEAEAQRAAALDKLRAEAEARYEELERKLQEAKTQQLNEQDELHNAEVTRLIDENDKTIEEKNASIAALEEQIKALQIKQEDLTRVIGNHEETIMELEGTVADRTAQVSAMREELVLRIEALRAQMQQEHREQLDERSARHVEEVQTMLAEFDEAQTYLKRQITSQAKKLQDAETKYMNREPREADLRQIEELERHLEQGKQIMSALMEELEHYKLELNNREANFNKIFNKTPVVGMMQTMPAKVKSQRSLTSIGSAKLPPLPVTASPH